MQGSLAVATAAALSLIISSSQRVFEDRWYFQQSAMVECSKSNIPLITYWGQTKWPNHYNFEDIGYSDHLQNLRFVSTYMGWVEPACACADYFTFRGRPQIWPVCRPTAGRLCFPGATLLTVDSLRAFYLSREASLVLACKQGFVFWEAIQSKTILS